MIFSRFAIWRQKFIRFSLAVLTVGVGNVVIHPVCVFAAAISVESKVASSGTPYHLIFRDRASIEWQTTRPSQADKDVVLCIPAAFTDAYGGVDGVYAEKGKFHRLDRPDKTIGGAVAVAGDCVIAPAPQGEIPGPLVHLVICKRGGLFQQFQAVENGKPSTFRDKSRFQRRGIAIFKDGRTAILESEQAITLSDFARDAAELGVQNLAYTDMGPWDEGWYRDPSSGKLVVMGQDRSLTYKQSNWLVFKVRSESKTGASSARH